MKPPISYRGSKRKHLKKIQEFEPKDDRKYELYDIYGGGGSVSLLYLERGFVVNYNDLFTPIVQLFTMMRDNDVEALSALECAVDEIIQNIRRDENLFYDIYDKYHKHGEKTLENFIVLTNTTFRSGISSRTINKYHKNGVLVLDLKKFKCPVIKLPQNKFHITQRDAMSILQEQATNPNAFIYIDPPYYSSNCDSYDHCQYDDIYTIKSIFEDKKTSARMMFHSEFQGYIYYMFKDFIKDVHPANFALSALAKKKIPKKFMCIITNY